MTIEHLRRSRFFQGLDEPALSAILKDAELRRVEPESFFFHQGDAATHFYLLSAGHARMLQTSPEGQQLILGIAAPAQEVGIIAAIEGAEYPLALQALSPAAALAWDRPAVLRMLERSPALALRALTMVSGRFVELQNRYRELATERVERRIARALLRLAAQLGSHQEQGLSLAIPLARRDLAEMTGTTLYTVSRTLSAWEQQGLVAAGRERVLLRDMERLRAIAEDAGSSF